MDIKYVICAARTEALYAMIRMIYIMKGHGHNPQEGLDAKTYRLTDRLTLAWLNVQVTAIRTIFLYRNRNTSSKYKFPACHYLMLNFQ